MVTRPDFEVGGSGHVAEHNRLRRHVHHVEEYGAAADGTTDETEAIAAAFDAAAANGGDIEFAPGKSYRITETVELISPSNLVRVLGRGAKILTTTNQQTALLRMQSDVGNIEIRDLILQGQGKNQSNIGLQVVNSRRCRVRHVLLQNLDRGIQMVNDGAAGEAWCEDNDFRHIEITACDVGVHMTKVNEGTPSFAATVFDHFVTSNTETHFLIDEGCNPYRSRFVAGTMFFSQTSGTPVGFRIGGYIGGTLFDVAMEESGPLDTYQPFIFDATATGTESCTIRCTLTNKGFASPALLDNTENGHPHQEWCGWEFEDVPVVVLSAAEVAAITSALA